MSTSYHKIVDFNFHVVNNFPSGANITMNVHNATIIIALTQVYKDLSVSPEVFDKCDDIYANWQQKDVLEADIEAVKRDLLTTLLATNMSDSYYFQKTSEFNSKLETLYDGLLDEIE